MTWMETSQVNGSQPNIPKEEQLDAMRHAISDLAETLPTLPTVEQSLESELADDATIYVSNDLHFGLMAWEPETGQDWDTNMVSAEVRLAYDYLFARSPASKVGIVVDLGDLTEADDFKNMTPHSGNVLDTDSRYPKVLRAAYEALMYAVNKALQKHEIVYFYNVAGNHDVSSGHAIREIMIQAYKDNPRVIIDESPSPIKYHQHGKCLFQFFHGDQMKMNRAGETMAVDCEEIFSETKHRYGHSGHWHRDIVLDGAIAKIESHRNLPPLNAWAHGAGYRRGIGTMKSITYNTEIGEHSRVIFPVTYNS